MIGFLKGTTKAIFGSEVVLETASGVGYRVSFAGAEAVKVGRQFECFISHVIRERKQTLYGFKTVGELSTFETLLTVSGVGPKSAFAIVKHLTPEKVRSAVDKGEGAVFATIPGIGKRVASKIVIELKDTLEKVELGMGADTEVVGALKNLGYAYEDIRAALGEIDPEHAVEQKVSQALKWLALRKRG